MSRYWGRHTVEVPSGETGGVMRPGGARRSSPGAPVCANMTCCDGDVAFGGKRIWATADARSETAAAGRCRVLTLRLSACWRHLYRRCGGHRSGRPSFRLLFLRLRAHSAGTELHIRGARCVAIWTLRNETISTDERRRRPRVHGGERKDGNGAGVQFPSSSSPDRHICAKLLWILEACAPWH